MSRPREGLGLMRRMGHSTVDAALVYLHATDDRDREIADNLAGYRKQAPQGTWSGRENDGQGEDGGPSEGATGA